MADHIARLRADHGLTQARMAEIAKVSQSAVSQWESGATHPSYLAQHRIAHALNMSVADAFGEDAAA